MPTIPTPADRPAPPDGGARRPRVLFVFVDGIGWGPDDRDTNPFARAELPNLARLLGRRPVADGRAVRPPALALDASMGVAGRPQSGTGQAALITGVNTAALLGAHRGPFPDPALRPALAAHSLWRAAHEAGASAVLATAYPPRLRAAVAAGRGRLSAVARAAVLAGVPLRSARLGGPDGAVPPILGPRPAAGAAATPVVADPHAAGAALAEVTRHHALTVYEHFEADMVGHRAAMAPAVAALERLDALLGGLLAGWRDGDVIVLASDHGNIEDATSTRHSLRPAIGAWFGGGTAAVPDAVTAVAGAIRAALGWAPMSAGAAEPKLEDRHALV